jgi:predicted ester cyclase
MTPPILDALLRLWNHPLPADDTEAQAAVRAVYTDPVTINGLSLDLGQLVGLVRTAQATYGDVERQILDVAEGDSKLAVAFVLRGHYVGPLRTVLGTVPPSGRRIEMRIIDILTLVDGRISNVWMTADELGVLASLDAITLVA